MISIPEPDSGLTTIGKVEHWHTIAQAHGRAAVEAARNCGLLLAEEQQRLKAEGVGWVEWCREHLPFSYETARRYIRVAENWNLSRVTDATSIRGAIEVLAEPKLPPKSLRPPTRQQQNENAIAILETEFAAGRLLNIAAEFGFKKVHNLQWIGKLTDQQRGELYCRLSTSERHRKYLDDRTQELVERAKSGEPVDDLESEAMRIVKDARERFGDEPTPWSRLAELARWYVPGCGEQVGLGDIAVGVSKWARGEEVAA